MKILGISPLDKDATVSVVEDGKVLFAAAEERFSRVKQHAGFPGRALECALEHVHWEAADVDRVVYAFLTADQEKRLMHKNVLGRQRNGVDGTWRRNLRAARARTVPLRDPVPGLAHPNRTMAKGALKNAAYWLLGVAPGTSSLAARHGDKRWVKASVIDHHRWQAELEMSLMRFGLDKKLERFEHHLSHAANSYLASGMDRALIVTLDGYGTGLAGSVSLGEGGRIKRLRNIRYPSSLGTFYENVTAALGYKPDRHAGKIVGLAAYGDPGVLTETLLARFWQKDGDYRIHDALNYFFDRYLASRFTMIDVAAAYQHVLEVVAMNLVDYWVRATGCSNVVLSGGVTANVKMNQRIFEVPEVEQIFVYPNMGDGGCGTGLALHVCDRDGSREPMRDAYLGPEYTETEMEEALAAAGLDYQRPNNLAGAVARHIHEGRVVARFDGRMEYGPRALGNRSILFHAKDPDVNQWLNQRLGRTEFMPFAPVTTWEDRHAFYENLSGAEHAAQFMTITFDCTPKMIEHCPAAVHVDGTARPQLLRREVNPVYYDILREYERFSGIPTLINTSFNMHEEPIVCTPVDAVRAYLDGRLDVLALGPFLVESAGRVDGGRATLSPEGPGRHRKPAQAVPDMTLRDEQTSADGWTARLCEIGHPAQVESKWNDLQARADYSFFQSWCWIEAWLHATPGEAHSLLLELTHEGKTVGLAVLGHNTLHRHNVFSAQALLVSESGIPSCDALTVEHSGLLVERGLEVETIERSLRFLKAANVAWDELYVSGVERPRAKAYMDAAREVDGLEPLVRFERPYFFVDLDELRTAGRTYLSTLSSNTRYQIRRSMRLYQACGPLRLRVAQSAEEARAMFLDMRKLHQHSWSRRGYPGAFLSTFANTFHERLVEKGHPRGEIQLVEVSAGEKPFGYLYNFILDGMVSNYQSAFLYEDDAKLKPGLVSHCLAIDHNLALGHKAYDLLMGDQRFKRSLTTHQEHMVALVLRQQRLKLRLESTLRDIWHKLKGQGTAEG